MIQGKKIIVGVSGGIAAYKAAELVRLLKKAGAEVQVVMTHDAGRFIPALTLGTLSEREVLSEIFPENETGSWTKHISLGMWADLFVIAPATAQTIAKVAHGFSDSMLTAVALAARCTTLVCPAMDHDMFVHPATQKNLETLEEFGYRVMQPEHGELASGLVGMGRLPEPESILARIVSELEQRYTGQGPLAGRTVLVTAGPTREPIDPVRYVTNHSSGRMGFAVAEAAAKRGANVVLVTGPTALDTPGGVRRVDVTTAADMHREVSQVVADVIVMAAAVADYTPASPSDSKLKKGSDDDLHLELTRTVDILENLGANKRAGQVLVGFALETDNGVANAREKLERKRLDLIVLNNPREEGAAFGHDTNRVTLLYPGGEEEVLGLLSKAAVSEILFDRVERILQGHPVTG